MVCALVVAILAACLPEASGFFVCSRFPSPTVARLQLVASLVSCKQWQKPCMVADGDRGAKRIVTRRNQLAFSFAIVGAGCLSDSRPALAAVEEEQLHMRTLTRQDAAALQSLTTSVGWDNTVTDVRVLLGMPEQHSVGLFLGNDLVSTATITFFPSKEHREESRAATAGWMSYVITHPDQQRKGFATRVCSEAVRIADEKHPGASIGLFGAPRAAPIYARLGFADLGPAATWTLHVDPRAVLRQDAAAESSGFAGTVAVKGKVRRVSAGGVTAEKIETLERLEAVLAADARVLGGSRAPALRALVAQEPSLAWSVPATGRRDKCRRLFTEFRAATGTRVLAFEGFRELLRATEGAEAAERLERREFGEYLAQLGALDDGLSEAELWELYQREGNNLDRDFALVFGASEAAEATQKAGERGWLFGRQDCNGGFYLGPVVADERDTLLALLLAGLRGASVRALAREEALGSAGAARRPLEVRLVGVAPRGAESAVEELLAELGFQRGGESSRFMVRSPGEVPGARDAAQRTGRGALYPDDGFARLVAQNYEF